MRMMFLVKILIIAENTIIDEPDCTLDSMEINIVGEANESNGHPSQESDVTVNAENSNIDEPDIIYDRSKPIDTSAEQTESIVDDDFDHNDVSGKELSVQCIHASEEVNTVDKVTDVNSDRRYDPDLNTVSDANVDIGLVASPFQHTCLKHLQDCGVNGD
jgi:hypothetical protein